MLIAVVVVLLVIGTVIFHFVSPWWFTPLASNWGAIDTTINITFWITGVVFVAINLFLAYCIVKFRYKKNRRAHYEPENRRLEGWLTLITSVGVAAMLAPGLLVWAKFVQIPENSAAFEAVGRQWQWQFRFPGTDGVFGQVDARLINAENPFGMQHDDPAGQDDILIDSNIVHLPIGQPVTALLRSQDVLHNFTVAQFRVKMDLVPGLVTYMWFEPTKLGTYDILCEELCGIAHHAMRGKVVVDEPADFENWLAGYPTYAETLAVAAGDAAAGQAQYAVCAACHGMQGEGNQTMNAPKLAGLNGWYLRKQIENYQAGIRGTHKDDIYGRQMQPMAATLVTAAAINNVIAYIETLPDNPAPATISGDVTRGQRLYRNCGACHGARGQGVWSVAAPRQAGMSDWYLVAQLKNFQQGIRGTHPDDGFGWQMGLMAEILHDDQAIDDVVAYINTL
ncbi:MAG: c-type cytochrome [Gammaproteobacteria bacterium]|nr:MAG: c-type cytochrome [Gammaproteobacteria bacterium]